MTVFRHWKKLGPKIQTLENATATKPREAARLSKLRVRSERAACALLWLVVPRSGIWAVGEWNPSIRSLFLFARAPENEDEKTGGTNRAARAAVVA